MPRTRKAASLVLAYITTSSPREARRIAESLLEKRLIACANIIRGVRSLYLWKGKRRKSRETLLLAKTKSSLQAKVIRRVKQMHSYECPCVVFLPISGGSADYLRWVHSSLV